MEHAYRQAGLGNSPALYKDRGLRIQGQRVLQDRKLVLTLGRFGPVMLYCISGKKRWVDERSGRPRLLLGKSPQVARQVNGLGV